MELRSRVSCVSQQNDEQQRELQGLKEEKEQLQAKLEDRLEERQSQVDST